MSNHGSTEELANRSLSENVEGEFPEFQMLTHESANEQNRGSIAPSTRQVVELTRLVRGMTTPRHPKSCPRTELGTTSGAAMPQSDRITTKLSFTTLGHLKSRCAAELKSDRCASSIVFHLEKVSIQVVHSEELKQPLDTKVCLVAII